MRFEDAERMVADLSENDAFDLTRACARRFGWLTMIYCKDDFAENYATAVAERFSLDADAHDERMDIDADTWFDMAASLDKAWSWSSIPDAVDEMASSILADIIAEKYPD